uniref:Reverse transcriptase domain-containing protein n=1 Tax=Tanacetum cinerariifolium TaxID=118510 RepID=A0A6L2KHB8_TANCI|nr:hypothetical protein [Tanacetum cinerariifolium]
MIQETTKKIILIKQRIQAAQDRQKSYADRKRKPMEFEVGDRVMLKKCYADEPLAMPLEGVHIEDTLQFVEEPVEIMKREIKRLKQSQIPLVKVRWNSRRGFEFTWEREDSFKQKYPHLFTNRTPSSTTRYLTVWFIVILGYIASLGGLPIEQVQVNVADAAEDEDAANEISVEPTPPSHTRATTPPPNKNLSFHHHKLNLLHLHHHINLPLLNHHHNNLLNPRISLTLPWLSLINYWRHEVRKEEKVKSFRIQEIKEDADEDVTLEEVAAKETKDVDVQGRLPESQAQVYHLDFEHAQKVLSMQETDEAEPAEVEEVIKVVTAAKLMIEVVTTTITVAHIPNASAPRRRRGVINEDPEEAATASLKQVKRKEKQDNTVMRYQALKRKPVTKAHTRKNMMAFLEKRENEIEEEESKESKRKSKSSEQKAAKKEDLEMLWKIILERFESSEPKNFSDDFLLNALKTMFEKPNVEANIWRNQRGKYGLAKVKTWKLLESYGVHIITFTTTQMILLVKRRYNLTRFTLKQMLNNVRLEVEEESEVSLELLRFVRRHQQEGYKQE